MNPIKELEKNSMNFKTNKFPQKKFVPFTLAKNLLREEKKQREYLENQLKDLIGPYNEIKAISEETLRLKKDLIEKLKQHKWMLDKMLIQLERRSI